MKNAKNYIGEAMIKVGIGALGSGYLMGLLKNYDLFFFFNSLLIGVLLITLGAFLAEEKK